jgi:hypothetical protein
VVAAGATLLLLLLLRDEQVLPAMQWLAGTGNASAAAAVAASSVEVAARKPSPGLLSSTLAVSSGA